MRYRISQIKINAIDIHDRISAIEKAILKKLRQKNITIYDIKIIKESIDARRKPDIKLVYTVDFSCDAKLELPEAKQQEYRFPEGQLKRRPVIAGFGPCGIFAALVLAEAGYRPVVIERGAAVDERVKDVDRFWKEGILDTESNVQFGEGGAGTFSDGKLTTGIKDPRISKVLNEFVQAGAAGSLLYKQKPHIGTDRLRDVVKNLRKKIEALGGEVMFRTKLTGIDTEEVNGERSLKGIEALCGSGEKIYLDADILLLATGHSARDTFSMLYEEGVLMERKPFSIGVRVIHNQSMINEAQYGNNKVASYLGAADYKLSHRCSNGRGVYTFCMCPGGVVINAASENDTAVTNGMSYSGRDGNKANSALLVDVRIDDFESEHPLAGIEFQRKYERLAYSVSGGKLPVSKYGKFRNDVNDVIRNCLPEFAVEGIIEAMPVFGRKLKGFDNDDTVIKGVETRSSSPVRILRDDTHQCNITGIFPAGEGPGYAGGIMSAAVDGIKTAEKAVILKSQLNIL